MWDLIVALGLMVYAGAIWYYSYLGLDLKSVLQILIGLGGGSFVLWSNRSYLLNLLSFDRTKNDDDLDTNVDPIEPKSDYQFKDFQALSYLKKRAIEVDSVEMLELVAEINNILFKESI